MQSQFRQDLFRNLRREDYLPHRVNAVGKGIDLGNRRHPAGDRGKRKESSGKKKHREDQNIHYYAEVFNGFDD